MKDDRFSNSCKYLDDKSTTDKSAGEYFIDVPFEEYTLRMIYAR